MSQSPTEPAETTELTESACHRMLAAERRRVVLELLVNDQPPIGLDELAEAVVTTDDDVEGPRQEHVKRVAVTLHHNHLPMMTNLGAIRYDPTTRRIEAVNVAPTLLRRYRGNGP